MPHKSTLIELEMQKDMSSILCWKLPLVVASLQGIWPSATIQTVCGHRKRPRRTLRKCTHVALSAPSKTQQVRPTHPNAAWQPLVANGWLLQSKLWMISADGGVLAPFSWVEVAAETEEGNMQYSEVTIDGCKIPVLQNSCCSTRGIASMGKPKEKSNASTEEGQNISPIEWMIGIIAGQPAAYPLCNGVSEDKLCNHEWGEQVDACTPHTLLSEHDGTLFLKLWPTSSTIIALLQEHNAEALRFDKPPEILTAATSWTMSPEQGRARRNADGTGDASAHSFWNSGGITHFSVVLETSFADKKQP